LFKDECGTVELVMTLSLSHNMQALPSSGAPKLRRVHRKSMICLVAKRAATNSEPAGCRFNASLKFATPIGRSGIDQVKDIQHGTTSGEILHENGILKSCGSDGFSSWDRHVRRHFFFGITMHTARPVMCDVIQVRAISDFGAEADGTFRAFLEVTADTVQTIEMTINLWDSTQSPHRHGCTADVVAAKRDCPLERSNEALAVFDVFGTASSVVWSSGSPKMDSH
jgi:hypothetical protein